MTKTMILCAATAFALGGAGTYAMTRPADAQNPPAAAADDPDGMRMGGHMDWEGHGGPGWGTHHHHMHHLWMMAKEWGLFPWTPDKHLTAADVQTIAQAILLRHGNHTWKVADVAQNQDNTISFAFATGDGSVIAHFAIDTRTGRIRRTG